MAKQAAEPSPDQHYIAQLLLTLTDLPFEPLAPKRNSSYLTLDAGKGANKNAVTVARDYVSFLVNDFGMEKAAESLGLATRRYEKPNSKRVDTRLRLLELDAPSIVKHADFFRDMLEAAYKESKDRQEH